MKRKVLFASYNLDIGGIEKALINLLNNLDYDKYDVTLILEHKKGILLDKLNKNVKVIEYSVSNNKNILIRKFKNMLKKIKFIIKNYHKYDFSCCYATYSYPANMISYYGSSNNSIYIHSNYKYIYNEVDLRKFFDTRRLEKFRKVIFVSNEARNDLIKYYPTIKDKSIVINNLINYEEIIKLSKEKIDFKKNNKKQFVFVGRLDENSKRISKLIDVFKEIDADLWIIGDGKDRNLYQDKIKNSSNIKMLGSKVNPYPYIKESDYVILTSDYEGFPVIYHEAIILEKKIITTIDVSDDYITIPNRFGYIISKDKKTMIKEIKNILKKDNLVMEKLDYQKMNLEKIKKLEEIIEEVI